MRIGNSLLHYLAVSFKIDCPRTQTTAAERDLLIAHLPGKRTIVEVGVFEGFTTQVLAAKSEARAQIYGVDPFFVGRLGVSWGYHIARNYNRNALRSGRLHLLRRLSTETDGEVPMPADFVFIDADHSIDGITSDWAFWSERIAPGGVIALHDVIVPLHNPNVSGYGSHIYFESQIRHDQRFKLVDSVDSLAVLRRVSAAY